MELLPDKNKLSKLLDCLKDIKTVNDINKFFFNYSSPFFQVIEKYYLEEGINFIKVFPFLLTLISEIDNIFKNKKLSILKTGQSNFIELTRKQVALIFFLSFLGLIDTDHNNENMNGFSVSYLLTLNYDSAIEFGRCFLNYLIVIGNWLKENNPILEQKIIYKRINNPETNYLDNEDNIPLCDLKIDNHNSLFDGEASYCVDFANKYIGGGALTGGCVQEEILFAVEPEATISMFLMEVMDDNDAIGIFNTIQYSKYKGYGYSFKFDGNLIDGKSELKKHRIIAIDAMDLRDFKYHNYFCKNKISKDEINRDIHKAYVGFTLPNDNEKTIATGNWGCGAFNGNHQLKFLQQWIAASYAKVKRLDYYSFHASEMKIVETYYEIIKNEFKTAKGLYDALIAISQINDNYIQNILSFAKSNK